MSLAAAIKQMESELDTLEGAKPGSTLWYVRQAKSLGLSMLRTANVLGADEPDALNRYRAGLRKELQPIPAPGTEVDPSKAADPGAASDPAEVFP